MLTKKVLSSDPPWEIKTPKEDPRRGSKTAKDDPPTGSETEMFIRDMLKDYWSKPDCREAIKDSIFKFLVSEIGGGEQSKIATGIQSMTDLSKTEKGAMADVSQGESMKPVDSFTISAGIEENEGLTSSGNVMKRRKKGNQKNKEEMTRMISCLTDQVEAESLSKDSFLLGGNFDGAYVQSNSEELMNCILYCFLFLLGREFDKDTMVQLWVAEGIFESEIGGSMEFLGGLIFDLMVDKKFILPCRFDNIYSHLKYRLNKNIFPEFPPGRLLPTDYLLHEEENKDNDYLIVEETKLDRISNGVKHLSLICDAFDLQTSEVLKSFRSLRTLILFCAHGTAINHVPYGIFHHLKQLRTLDMQGFNISHLPGTVGDLESLRYLDVSETQIKYLPESIGSLNWLQALKLNGCLELHRLPKRTKDLISLRHLDLDIVGQLKSMPSGIGSLTNLQTLRAFLIGKEDGCGVAELKNLANLSGSICISRLENVLNSEDAREAELSNKKHLSKLTFQWDSHYHDQVEEEDILEGLQPHSGIKELEILFFNGSKLPTWISNSSFLGITNILLFKCRNCSQLPSLGRLPSLKFLEIYEMNAVKFIDHLFCGNDTSQEHHAFPKLEKLTLDFMLNLEEWIGVEDGDFPSLLELRLKHCPKLFSLSLLSHLHSLRYLEIIGCTEFQSLPDSGIPLSVQTMVLKDCPGAKDRCANSDSQDSYKIAHIPSVFLDHEEVFPNKQANKIACIPSVDQNGPEIASPYEDFWSACEKIFRHERLKPRVIPELIFFLVLLSTACFLRLDFDTRHTVWQWGGMDIILQICDWVFDTWHTVRQAGAPNPVVVVALLCNIAVIAIAVSALYQQKTDPFDQHDDAFDQQDDDSIFVSGIYIQKTE